MKDKNKKHMENLYQSEEDECTHEHAVKMVLNKRNKTKGDIDVLMPKKRLVLPILLLEFSCVRAL